MNFASKYVLADSGDEYESLSEEEFEQGMHVSDSNSSESDGNDEAKPGNCGADGQSTSKKKRLRSVKYHWRRKFPCEKGDGKQDVKNVSHSRRSGPLCSNSGKALPGATCKSVTRRKFRKADTNVVSVTFDALLSPGNMYAGDPLPCPKCSAILSHISKTKGLEQKVWQCEFCGEQVPVDLEPEEIPTTEDVTYLLFPALSTTSTSMAGLDQSLVVFCVDTSGSMCVTSEISGKVKLRGNNQLRRLESFNEGNENQFLPSQRNREVTYVSRLQAMQAAVDHQLTQMALQHPDRRVALVAFNNEVAIMGDGNGPEIIVAGDKLNNLEMLRKITQDLKMPQAIKQTHKRLGEKVYSLEEGGATALGPALVVAVNIAASHPGSKVILCTDGKANIGLGKLEGDGDRDERAVEEEALEFYANTAEEASEKGVTVSVITIQGTDCKLVHLGTLADKTGGQVNIVDCLKLTEEFGNILADPVIATKVKATFLLHKELYVLNDSDPAKQQSRVEQNVGNVKKSSSISFEFAKRKSLTESDGGSKKDKAKNSKKKSESELGKVEARATASSKEILQEFPFQLQIEYFDAEGNKALRVITRKLPATTDRTLTEEAVNLEVLGAHAAKKSADLALKGQYSHSRGVALMNQRLAWRQAHSDNAPKDRKKVYHNIFGKIKSMENYVHQKQMMEIQEYGRTRSDSEDDDDCLAAPVCHSRSLVLSADRKQNNYDVPPADGARSAQEKDYVNLPPQQGDAMYCNVAPPLALAITSEASAKPRSFLGFKDSRPKSASKHKKMHSERSSEMGDQMANMIYQFRSVGGDKLSAPTPANHEDTEEPPQSGSNSSAP